ncbi:hypothetical protein [Rhizobacter sp. Root1221]|uniref:hypothetical protein n=1 Tax=Rhizobacter sp. Root1221 TaxID=1736433 RepID=UPI0006F80DAF|nr:hypothetical protein [Rhizobacter sp. Root1221]KQV85456.1 hypothetical protein ASC87_07130 [Rhizobacter sp. Root1221]
MADFAATEFHADPDLAERPPALAHVRPVRNPIAFPAEDAARRRAEAARLAEEVAIKRHERLQALFDNAKRQAHAAGRAQGREERQLTVWLWGASTGLLLAATPILYVFTKAA